MGVYKVKTKQVWRECKHHKMWCLGIAAEGAQTKWKQPRSNKKGGNTKNGQGQP